MHVVTGVREPEAPKLKVSLDTLDCNDGILSYFVDDRTSIAVVQPLPFCRDPWRGN